MSSLQWLIVKTCERCGDPTYSGFNKLFIFLISLLIYLHNCRNLEFSVFNAFLVFSRSVCLPQLSIFQFVFRSAC